MAGRFQTGETLFVVVIGDGSGPAVAETRFLSLADSVGKSFEQRESTGLAASVAANVCNGPVRTVSQELLSQTGGVVSSTLIRGRRSLR